MPLSEYESDNLKLKQKAETKGYQEGFLHAIGFIENYLTNSPEKFAFGANTKELSNALYEKADNIRKFFIVSGKK